MQKKATDLSIKYIKKNQAKYYSVDFFDFAGLMFETNQFLLNQKIAEVKTTYCSVCLTTNHPNTIHYSSLGDSRVYLINPQYLTQLTKDDKYLASQNIITKCLGMQGLQKDDFYGSVHSILDTEQILLCSDGFYNLMEKKKIAFFETFAKHYLNPIKNNLHELIKKNNHDDSTYILIK